MKGNGYGYPLKIILPTDYPQRPPRIYFDMQVDMSVLDSLPYVNKQSKQIETDSIRGWRSNYALEQVVHEVCTTIGFQPPNSGPQQQQQQPSAGAWGNQQVAG